jgi:hypothetical protein
MSQSYRPAQHPVRVRALTDAGFLEGTLHLAASQRLLSHLRGDAAILRLTDVVLPGRTATVPFFALERDAVIAIVPPEGEAPETMRQGQALTVHATSCLAGSVVIEGELETLAGVRVSDALAHQTGFVALRRAVICLPAAGGTTRVEGPFAHVAVQARRVVGFSEEPG